jgi:(4S)-4-hydroxy-5-phosphonooxypentane-2,3-dione isomerase
MVVLVAKYYVKPGKGDEVEAALRKMAVCVREQEPGCLLYHVNRSRENVDLFLLYEQYRDMAALDAHRATPHFRAIIEGTIVPLLDKREREFYEPITS